LKRVAWLVAACGVCAGAAAARAADADGGRFGVSPVPVAAAPGSGSAALDAVIARHRAARTAGVVPDECEALAAAYRAAAAEAGPDARFNAGVVLLECGRTAEAEAAFAAMTKDRPEYARAWCALGALDHARGDVAHARERYEHCLDLDPSIVEGNVNLGAIEVADYERTLVMERLKFAVKHIRTALASEASSPPARTLIGYVYYIRGGGLAFIERHEIDKLVADAPMYAPAWNLRGLFLLREHKIHDAIAAFREALVRDPTYVPALVNWAATAGRYRDFDTAIEKLERALELGANDKEVLLMLAGALRAKAGTLADAPAGAALLKRADELEARAAALP
jgi:tetratricopeptide (TPR) repeat protein